MTKALVIVDTQNDFCEGGALPVAGGNAVAAGIRKHVLRHSGMYSLIVATLDWHSRSNDNGGHFSFSPDYDGTWPVHCVEYTHGAALHDELPLSMINEIVLKGQGSPDYSGFQALEAETKGVGRRTLRRILLDENVDEIHVVGLAYDWCVAATAIDGQSYGFKVEVLRDLTAPVSDERAAEQTDEMLALGVKIT